MTTYAVMLGCIGQGHPPAELSQEQAIAIARDLARLCEGRDYAASAAVVPTASALPLLRRWRAQSPVCEELRPGDALFVEERRAE